METTISSKYQVVIPKDIRRKLNLRPQQKLLVIEKSGILYMIPQKPMGELRGAAEKVSTSMRLSVISRSSRMSGSSSTMSARGRLIRWPHVCQVASS